MDGQLKNSSHHQSLHKNETVISEEKKLQLDSNNDSKPNCARIEKQ